MATMFKPFPLINSSTPGNPHHPHGGNPTAAFLQSFNSQLPPPQMPPQSSIFAPPPPSAGQFHFTQQWAQFMTMMQMQAAAAAAATNSHHSSHHHHLPGMIPPTHFQNHPYLSLSDAMIMKMGGNPPICNAGSDTESSPASV